MLAMRAGDANGTCTVVEHTSGTWTVEVPQTTHFGMDISHHRGDEDGTGSSSVAEQLAVVAVSMKEVAG